MAFRQLAKYRFHTIVSALCMAVGLTINGYIGYIIKSQLVYTDTVTVMKVNGNTTTYAEYKDIVGRGIDGLYGFYTYEGQCGNLLAYNDNVEKLYPALIEGVSHDFFKYYRDQRSSLVISGNDTLGENEIMISYKLADKIFGENDPIGQTLTLVDDTVATTRSSGTKYYVGKTYRIVGVCDNVEINRGDYRIYITLHDEAECRALVYARIKDGYSTAQVNKQIGAMEWKGAKDAKPYSLSVIPMFDSDLWVLIALLVIFSLMIFVTGLINFMKFMIQMFYSRQRELALRKCLGSGNRGLYMLLACEVFIMLALSYLLSCVTSELSLIYLNYISFEFFDEVTLGALLSIQAETTVIALLVAFVVILLPIIKLRQASIRGSLLRRRRGNKMRYFMVGLQFLVVIVSFCFLAVAIHHERKASSHFEGHISGKELNRIFRIYATNRNWDDIRPLLEKLPIVEEYTSCQAENLSKSTIHYEKIYVGGDSIHATTIAYGAPSYFSFFNIQVDGKIVADEASNYVYIDRKLHNSMLEHGNYDGTVELSHGRKYPVAGIIDYVFTDDNHTFYASGYGNVKSSGSIYFVSPQREIFYYRIKDGVPLKEARKAFIDIYYKFIPSTFDVEINTFAEVLDEMNAVNRTLKHVAYLMAFISLLVVVMGIYSTISLDATTKQKEIAIRKINGARRSDILGRFAMPYFITFTVTFLAVYPLLISSLNTITLGMSAGDLLAIGAMIYVGVLLLLALVTWHRIKMIMNVNPADVIRRE